MSIPEQRADEVAGTAGCVRRAAAGDETALSQLYDMLYPLVARIVRAHRPRYTPEEDLVQTVFLKVFSKLEQYSGTVPLEHWVSRIAVNTCLKQLRRERARPELRWPDLSEQEEEVVRILGSRSEDVPVSRRLAARELVEKLLDMLKPKDRLVVTLLYLEARSVEEVSHLVGWSKTLVKVRAFRARQKMRWHLERLIGGMAS